MQLTSTLSVHIFANDIQALTEAGTKLNQTLESLQKQSVPILFLLSGGSALKLLDNIDFSNLNTDVTLGVLDERFSQDPSVNNWAQIMALPFYAQAQARGCHFIDTRVKTNETPEVLGARFHAALTQWINTHQTGKIIATLGMGPDGHTAGIMPFPEAVTTFHELFINSYHNRLVTVYDAGSKNEYPQRVTANFRLLKKVDHAIAYITGENKREAMSNLSKPEVSLAHTPARVMRKMKDVSIYTTEGVYL